MQKLLAAALLCISCNTLYAQAQPDTTVNASYNKKIAASGDLYYGIEHIGYLQKLNGTPYFESNEWQKGSVTYHSVLYSDVLLKYDLITDELIVLHPNNFFAITLVSERVQSFTLGQQEFVYVPKLNKLGLKESGFYHVLVSGKLSVIAKRAKKIEEKTSTGEIERNIVSKEYFYAVKDGIATSVNGEESVMSLLGAHARQVRSHLRTKEIKFRKSKELSLFEIATYYNQLAK
jgi:hypothetical protein